MPTELPKWDDLSEADQRLLIGLASTFGPTPDNLLSMGQAKGCAMEMFITTRNILQRRIDA